MQYPNPHPVADESVGTGPDKIKLRDVYVRKTGRREKQDIWIVDGFKVRRDIFDEFLQGGNDQRFRFVPQNEIWIDGSTSVCSQPAKGLDRSASHRLTL